MKLKWTICVHKNKSQFYINRNPPLVIFIYDYNLNNNYYLVLYEILTICIKSLYPFVGHSP